MMNCVTITKRGKRERERGTECQLIIDCDNCYAGSSPSLITAGEV